MSHAEKANMRANLHVLMRERPVMEKVLAPRPRLFASFFTLSKSLRATLAAVLIIVVTGGGVASAAEGAIPGDVLYPVKINVNEKIKTALAKTPQAKAKLHVELVNERLKEAEKLSVEGKLTATTTAELSDNFKLHADAVEASSTDQSEQNKLEVVLEAHQRILTRLTAREATSSKSRINSIAERVQVRVREAGAKRAEKREAKIEAEVKKSLRKETLTTPSVTLTASTTIEAQVELQKAPEVKEDTGQESEEQHEHAIDQKVQEVEKFIDERSEVKSETKVETPAPAVDAGVKEKVSL